MRKAMSTCAHCGIVRVHITLFFQCSILIQAQEKVTFSDISGIIRKFLRIFLNFQAVFKSFKNFKSISGFRNLQEFQDFLGIFWSFSKLLGISRI
jgi:hypothetical protein